MSAPTFSLSDLWRAWFNGGTDAEMAALQAFYDAGFTFLDILDMVIAGGGGGIDGSGFALNTASPNAGLNVKFPNTHTETDASNLLSHVAFYNHGLNPAVDRGTRIYVEPNGDVHPVLGGPGGTGGFIKFFLNPISRQPGGVGKNYVDMGVGVVYDINGRKGLHDVGMALINVKSNGVDFDDAPNGGKWMDIVFMAQDGGRVGGRMMYLPVGYNFPLVPGAAAVGGERLAWWWGDDEPGVAMQKVLSQLTGAEHIFAKSDLGFCTNGRGLRWYSGTDYQSAAGLGDGDFVNVLKLWNDRAEFVIGAGNTALTVGRNGLIICGTPDSTLLTTSTTGYPQLPYTDGPPTGDVVVSGGHYAIGFDKKSRRLTTQVDGEAGWTFTAPKPGGVFGAFYDWNSAVSAAEQIAGTIASPSGDRLGLEVGDAIEIDAGGDFLNNFGSTQTVIPALKIGSTTFTEDAASVGTGVQRREWYMKWLIYLVGMASIRIIGPGIFGASTVSSASWGAVSTAGNKSFSNAAIDNLTGSRDISLAFTLSQADALMAIKVNVCTMRVIRKMV